MIGIILLQRSEGGGLVSGTQTGLISVRGRADLLTRLTSILATCFFINSIILAILAGGYHKADKILNPLESTEKVDVPLSQVSPSAEKKGEDQSIALEMNSSQKEEGHHKNKNHKSHSSKKLTPLNS